MGSRRLADPRVALPLGAYATRSRAESSPPDQPMEDPRQSETKPRRAERVRAPCLGLDLAARVALGVDPRGDRGPRLSDLSACLARPQGSRGPSALRRFSTRLAPRAGDRGSTGPPRADAARVPLLRDGPCDRAHARADDLHAEEAARMGDGGRGGGPLGGIDGRPGPARFREWDVGEP